MEEEEKMVERRLEEVQGKGENILGRRTNLVGQICGWKELKDSCKQMVREVAGMCEMARGRVEQLKGDISIVVERRNTILMMDVVNEELDNMVIIMEFR